MGAAIGRRAIASVKTSQIFCTFHNVFLWKGEIPHQMPTLLVSTMEIKASWIEHLYTKQADWAFCTKITTINVITEKYTSCKFRWSTKLKVS